MIKKIILLSLFVLYSSISSAASTTLLSTQQELSSEALPPFGGLFIDYNLGVQFTSISSATLTMTIDAQNGLSEHCTPTPEFLIPQLGEWSCGNVIDQAKLSFRFEGEENEYTYGFIDLTEGTHTYNINLLTELAAWSYDDELLVGDGEVLISNDSGIICLATDSCSSIIDASVVLHSASLTITGNEIPLAVPLPASAWLFLSALIGLGGTRRLKG